MTLFIIIQLIIDIIALAQFISTGRKIDALEREVYEDEDEE